MEEVLAASVKRDVESIKSEQNYYAVLYEAAKDKFEEKEV